MIRLLHLFTTPACGKINSHRPTNRMPCDGRLTRVHQLLSHSTAQASSGSETQGPHMASPACTSMDTSSKRWMPGKTPIANNSASSGSLTYGTESTL